MFLSEEKWFHELFDYNAMQNPAYCFLIISQCLNAIGFLNLTTFLNVHLYQTMGYDNVQTAMVLTVMQVCDCIGRFSVPYVADALKNCCHYSIHIFYMIGTVGTGACMMVLSTISTHTGIYITCALTGLFSRYVNYKLKWLILTTSKREIIFFITLFLR